MAPIPRPSRAVARPPWEAWNGCLREADRSCRAAANSTKGTVIGRCVGRNFFFEVTDLLDHERKEICAFRTALPCSNHRPNSLIPNTHPHAGRASNMIVLDSAQIYHAYSIPYFPRCRFLAVQICGRREVVHADSNFDFFSGAANRIFRQLVRWCSRGGPPSGDQPTTAPPASPLLHIPSLYAHLRLSVTDFRTSLVQAVRDVRAPQVQDRSGI